MYFQRGCAKYTDQYLDLNIRRLKRAALKTKGFVDMSLFPEFIDELPRINASKTVQNICLGVTDFADFLVEKFGAAGPSQFLKPEQMKQCVKTFSKAMNRPAREHQQAQLYLDFQELPGVSAFRSINKLIMDLLEKFLEKAEYLKRADVDEYYTMRCCFIAMIIFRNACGIAPPIYLRHEHLKQLCRDDEASDYVMPLAPKKLVRRRKLVESLNLRRFFIELLLQCENSNPTTDVFLRKLLFSQGRNKSCCNSKDDAKDEKVEQVFCSLRV